ncbi:AAA family ATPase [Sorangium sp. So ce375]|uniref:nSTAND1 domain-containing NTPase n=1 Tax=Sorangium sp. So ce375 TaxID=3133306 RepID=UPI003F5C5E8B
MADNKEHGARKGDQKFRDIEFNAGRVFTPSAPIDQQRLFAGRLKQLRKTLDAIGAKGQHVVLYGERGVGKTSLASTVTHILSGPSKIMSVRQNCHEGDTYGRIWKRAFSTVTLTVTKPRIGFSNDVIQEVKTLASSLSDEPEPDEVIMALRQIDAKIVFIFDEFDQIADKRVSNAFAETIKALSDYAVSSTIVLVGVGDSVDALIASHASVERAIVQILLPRMRSDELSEIIAKAMVALGTTCDDDAKERIVRLSQGLPHYVHLLGLHSVRYAAERGSTNVGLDDVNHGIEAALADASQSVLDAYLKAVSTPQKTLLFRDILLACALTATDELGCFTPASIRPSLKVIGQDLDIPAFAGHLNKFASAGRGDILQKIGVARRFRYRFKNPLLQPYVVMRGVAEGLISIKDAERLLAARVPARQ